VISIIIPAHRADPALHRCLDAVVQLRSAMAGETAWECVVVDDGSVRESVSAAAAAAGFGCVRLDERSGPAAARNRGALAAAGDILFFVDADVLIPERAAIDVQAFFASRQDVAALFGSYDANPEAPGLTSQYKNLTHHYVHQQGSVEAFTFWAGCGAIRRRAFLQAGGFDERYDRPCIEDIELGYRLKQRNERIVLLKSLMVTHLKRWTFRNAVVSDLFDRGVPWVRLLLRSSGTVASDLNLGWTYRASVALVWIAAAAAVSAAWTAAAWGIVAAAIAGVVLVNRRYLGWLVQVRGWWFTARVLPLYLLHHFCNGLSVVIGGLLHLLAFDPPPRLLNVEPSQKP
jgi:glycosyltransferase involved in cell wall biosynthesis